VALAGFAGVVVAFHRESVHEWSAVDKRRLRFWLTNSILPLGLCMLGLLLLTIKPMPPGIWRLCSGVAFVVFLLFVTTSGKVFRRLNLQEVKRQRLSSIVFYIFATIGTPVLLLQLYNTVFLGAF
jgi:hypothetical protein